MSHSHSVFFVFFWFFGGGVEWGEHTHVRTRAEQQQHKNSHTRTRQQKKRDTPTATATNQTTRKTQKKPKKSTHRQHHVDVAVQDDAKQLAVVVPRLAARAQARRAARVQVPEVQLLVQQAEDVVLVDEVADEVDGRPGPRLEVAVAELRERDLVHRVDLRDVALPLFLDFLRFGFVCCWLGV